VRTQQDDLSDAIAVVDKDLPHNGEQGRGALGTFTAAGTSTTIGFLNEDPSSDNSNGIDNVVLTPGMTSIPAPTSLLLFATSGLGLFLRRKP